MPKIHYSQVIEEDAQELKELERYHRYTHLFQRVRMLRLLKTEECTNLGEAARALGYSWRQCHRWFASYKKGGLQELLKSRVSERGRQELVTPEAFEELQEAMKRGRSPPYLRLTSSLESATASSTLTLTASANSSGDARSSLRRVVPATRKPTKKSSRPSKKLRRPGRAGGRWPRQPVEGFGLRRGTLRADQLAQEALLRVDLPLRRGGAHHGGELLPVPAWDGRRMPADIPRRALEGLPRRAPAGSARRRPQPPLREDRPSGEREPPRVAGLLPGAGPGGEVVPGVQTKVVQQDLRERRPNARGAHPDAFALQERPRAPQTAHRIPLVGGGGGGIVTSIARNGIIGRSLNGVERKAGAGGARGVGTRERRAALARGR